MSTITAPAATPVAALPNTWTMENLLTRPVFQTDWGKNVGAQKVLGVFDKLADAQKGAATVALTQRVPDTRSAKGGPGGWIGSGFDFAARRATDTRAVAVVPVGGQHAVLQLNQSLLTQVGFAVEPADHSFREFPGRPVHNVFLPPNDSEFGRSLVKLEGANGVARPFYKTPHGVLRAAKFGVGGAIAGFALLKFSGALDRTGS